jgi:putative endonuclease
LDPDPRLQGGGDELMTPSVISTPEGRRNLKTRKSDFYVYIVTNKRHTVFYTGITSDLIKRVYQHKHKLLGGFSSKYNTDQLVYFEQLGDPENAILREKQVKDYRREKKFALINKFNPGFEDLYDGLY